MSVEHFIKRMKEDQNFAQKIVMCSTKEQLVKEAKMVGIELREEDINQVKEILRSETLTKTFETTDAGRFILKLMDDQDFALRVLKQPEVEGVIEVAKESGFALSQQDILEADRILGTHLGETNSVMNAELSEEDLEQVAGGTLLTSTEIIISSLSVVGTIYASFIVVASVTLVKQAIDNQQG